MLFEIGHYALYILEVAMGIGFLIFIHELGHFILAKKVGVRVETFSLGFGPRLLGAKKVGGRLCFIFGSLRGEAAGPETTDYRISLIPLGGYVKMTGENPDEERTGAPYEFPSKTVGQRAAVISAGVALNALFGVLAFVLAFRIGVTFIRPVVGEVLPGSPAEGVLLRGDRILKLDGREMIAFSDIATAIAFSNPEEGIELEVERNKKRLHVKLRPERKEDDDYQKIGIGFIHEITKIEEGSPAAEAGFQEKDIVLGVNGERAKSIRDIEDTIFRSPGKALSFLVHRGGREMVIRSRVRAEQAYTLGIELSPIPVVARILPGTPADRAKLKADDRLISLDGTPLTYKNLRDLIQASKGRMLDLVLQRGGETVKLSVQPEPKGKGFALGIAYGAPVVEKVEEGSPAARAGIRAGDILLRAGDFESLTPENLERIVNQYGGEILKLVWTRKGEKSSARVRSVKAPERYYGSAGAKFGSATFTLVSQSLPDSCRLGLDRTRIMIKRIFLTINGLFSRKVSAKTLGGPVRISILAFTVAKLGFGTLVYFLALLSINLAVINLLPIPILDGGHLVFLLVEKIKGSPLSESLLIYTQWIGLFLIVALMLFITTNDILQLFQ
jgi:regulator of sigma E protease